MEVYAMGAEMSLITPNIPYISLQWVRRYYQVGEFYMQIPADLYNPDWAYLGTNERPELGIIQKVDYSQQAGQYVMLSGFFAESLLNDKVCYPRFVGSGSPDSVCTKIFEKYAADLDIAMGTGRTNDPTYLEVDITDDFLGTRLYSILESCECSQRVNYDFVNNAMTWNLWKGVDRVQSQTQNPFFVFSNQFGNIASAEVINDYSGYKNYAIIPCDESTDSDGKVTVQTFYLDRRKDGERKREIVFDMRNVHPEDGQTWNQFRQARLQEAGEMLAEYAIIDTIDVNIIGEGYLDQFDLGDKVDVIIDTMKLAIETRIVEIQETFDSSGHTITVGFGNKRNSLYFGKVGAK